MRAKPIIAILLALTAAIPVLGQVDAPPWDVRAYLSTYTDATHTWNYTAIRHLVTCPYCGYSTSALAQGEECPNPWGVAGHGVRNLVVTNPNRRVLGWLDVLSADASGNVAYPLVGRPFHPAGSVEPAWKASPAPWVDPVPEDRASWVTLRASGLTTGPQQLVADNDGLRFLVIAPGSVRASATHSYFTQDPITGMDVASSAAAFYMTDGDAGEATADEYLFQINPYRVSDGDVFYIRHTEVRTDVGGVYSTQVNVEVYSKLYGNDFNTAGTVQPGADFYTDGKCRIITNSGALQIEIPRQFSAAAPLQGSWLIKIVINSNTTILPTPEEVDFDGVYGDTPPDDIYNDPGEEEPRFAIDGIGADMSYVKQAYVLADSALTPSIATAGNDAYPVVEKNANGGFTSEEIWPYHIAPSAAGRGRVLLQWSDLTPSVDLAVSTDDPDADTFYRTGAEWHYIADLADPSNRLMDNADVAAQTALVGLEGVDWAFVDSYFMVSRLDVPLTGDHWARWEPTPDAVVDLGPAETDSEDATGGHTRVVVGNHTLTVGDPLDPDYLGYGGQFGPGTRTPSREFAVANRLYGTVLVCPAADGGCGARYLLGQPHTSLPDGQIDPGDPCPACGVALVRQSSEAHVQYDAPDALLADLAEGTYAMTPDALQFGPAQSIIPPRAVDFLQRILVDIPAYQQPSVPGLAVDTGDFRNDIENDEGYRGTAVVYAPDADAAAAEFGWGAYYLAPGDGSRIATPGAAQAQHLDAICPVCALSYPAGTATCPYCGAAMVDNGPPLPEAALTADEYDPFGVQVSVTRKPALAADERVVDLGWVAPGTPVTAPNTTNPPGGVVAGSRPSPADVSQRSDIPVRNEGNINSLARMRAGLLFRTEVDPNVRSISRWGQSLPVTAGTLYRYRPGDPSDVEFDALDWALWRNEATAAAGQQGTALLQAGIRTDATAAAYPDTIKPVPMGQPVGNYGSDVLLFVDLNGNGLLDFYDAAVGATTTALNEFDPDVDEPLEPVASFATRMRVVESRLPQSDFYSRDVDPTLLLDPSRNSMQVLWAGQRAVPAAAAQPAPAGVSRPQPSSPWNLLYADAELFADATDPLYRGWLWTPGTGVPNEANALTTSSTPNESNASVTAYTDAENNMRWAMWHRSLTTGAGMSSQLRFDSSDSAAWSGSDAMEYIFGTSGAHSGLTGFVRDGAENMHWLLWHAGPTGREHLRYRWEWDPTSGVVPGDAILPVSNAGEGAQANFFLAGTDRYRKPAHNPFTYVTQPSAFGGYTSTGEFTLDVFFTGHIRSLGNSDICWTHFNFGDPAAEDFPFNGIGYNYGKTPFPRVVGLTYPYADPRWDARGMGAIYDADGVIRGYPGEQLENSPRRQSFQARDIDWLLTQRVADPNDAANPFSFEGKPDWTGWATTTLDPKPTTASYVDPKFYLGVVVDTGTGPMERLYDIEWANGRYDASTGLYQVTPVLTQLTSAGLADLPLNPGHPDNDHLGELLAPTVRNDSAVQDAFTAGAGDYEDWPSVTLMIDPASGTLNWSAALFNPDNPSDRLAVFNETNTPGIADVVMYADYTPFVRRVTTDQANDDSPSAFYDLGGSSRLTVFWRRNYGDTDTPHFGRPSFMHRTLTTAVQVGRPPINAITSVTDLTSGEALVDGTSYVVAEPNDGIIVVEPGEPASLPRAGHRIEVHYTDGGGVSRTEQHRVIGWSIETPVPVNTVVSEGPLRVIPEVYETTVGATTFNSVRFWLVWSSTRGVYDLRSAAAGGQRVHEAADLYLAVVAPEYANLISDLEIPQLTQ